MAKIDFEDERGVRLKKAEISSDAVNLQQLLDLKAELMLEIQNLKVDEINISYDFPAGENVSLGEICYLKSDGFMWKANASAESTAKGLLGMATRSIYKDDVGRFLMYGKISLESAGSLGSVYYLHTSDGDMTATPPSGSGQIVRVVCYGLGSISHLFYPDVTWVKIK